MSARSRLYRKLASILITSIAGCSLLISCGVTNKKEETKRFQFEDIVWLKEEFKSIRSFKNERAVVTFPDNYLGVINEDGEVLVDSQSKYVAIGDFTDKITYVATVLATYETEGKYGYIDKQGKIVFPLEFQIAGEISDGVSFIQLGNDAYYMDMEGKMVTERVGSQVGPFNDGLAPIMDSEADKFGYMDKQGQDVIPFMYYGAQIYEDNLAPVQGEDGKWFFVNKDNQKVIDGDFDEVLFFNLESGKKLIKNECIKIKKDNKVGLIDTKGNVLMEPEFEDLDAFVEDLALVKKDGKYGYINKEKEFAIAAEFDDAGSFVNGLARVKKGDKYGYINEKGEEIIPLEYEDAIDFYDNRAFVKKDGKWGILKLKQES